jgi:hypothetical protein
MEEEAMNRHAPRRTFRPQWPGRETVDPERVALTYDRPSDTLFIHFSGRPQPAVSVPADARFGMVDIYLRVDSVSEEVVGLQIEGALAAADRPARLHDALVVAGPSETGANDGRVVHRGTVLEKGAVLDALLDAVIPVAA